MKNVSIRTRILCGVAAIMVLGTAVMMVYLHQTFSGGLDVAATKSLALSSAGWTDLHEVAGTKAGEGDVAKAGAFFLGYMKDITGADYGLLLDKNQLDAATYAKEREAVNLADNWDEQENYVLVAATDEAAADKMLFNVTADAVPEMGKVVGIENGACSRTCHGSVKGSGDYWTVNWSTDAMSRAHAVFPVTNAEGKPVGVIYSIADISEQADADRASLLRTLLVIGLTLLISTLVIGGMLDTLVFKRLGRMITEMEELSIRVAGGDFSAHFEPDGTDDEIGKFERFFSSFIDLVASTLKSLSER